MRTVNVNHRERRWRAGEVDATLRLGRAVESSKLGIRVHDFGAFLHRRFRS